MMMMMMMIMMMMMYKFGTLKKPQLILQANMLWLKPCNYSKVFPNMGLTPLHASTGHATASMGQFS